MLNFKKQETLFIETPIMNIFFVRESELDRESHYIRSHAVHVEKQLQSSLTKENIQGQTS